MDPYDFEIPDVIVSKKEGTLSDKKYKQYKDLNSGLKAHDNDSKKLGGTPTTLQKGFVARSTIDVLEKANDYLMKASVYARSSR